MVLQVVSGGRAVGVLLCAIMVLSTGVASSTVLEGSGVGGHATYVAAVVEAPSGIQGVEHPLHYGLATLRVDYVFGLVSKDRPVDDSDEWLVFAWAKGAPDPREDPTIRPTGDIARVADRTGATWTVYELAYEADGVDYHAYAVEVGPKRTLEDGTSYNHVLTYRPERLVAPLQEQAVRAEAADPAAELGQSPDTFSARGVIPKGPRIDEYPVVTGLARAPPILEATLAPLRTPDAT